MALTRVVSDETEHNPAFALKLNEEFGINQKSGKPKTNESNQTRRRRTSATFDPVEEFRLHDRHYLRSKLSGLELEQLKDVVAQYGIDPGKLIMKWKAPERIIDRIVEISEKKAKKVMHFGKALMWNQETHYFYSLIVLD